MKVAVQNCEMKGISILVIINRVMKYSIVPTELIIIQIVGFERFHYIREVNKL